MADIKSNDFNQSNHNQVYLHFFHLVNNKDYDYDIGVMLTYDLDQNIKDGRHRPD